MKKSCRETIGYNAPLVVSILLIILLLILPTGYEEAVIYKGTEHGKAEIISVDNSEIISTGLIKSGEQTCVVEVKEGKFKGRQVSAYNLLTGSLESDKIYKVGDTALVVINFNADEIVSANMIDHYRIDKEALLVFVFAAFLILFAGKTGIRAVFSFTISILMIWKVLVPLYLNGHSPVFTGIGITVILTIIIISLVYGFDKRCLSAVSGSLLGTLTTCVFGMLFTDIFRIHGAVMSYSESLLYSGYEALNLTQIFMAGIFIGASGAMMDLAVDITSAVSEVIQKKPEIGWREAARSGMNVGKAAMGTMTTTLLLAYSGGYIALLMVFMAQGTPVYNILNYKYVSAELLDTIVGSIGLVTVAPFTALTSAVLLTVRKGKV